MRWIPWAHVVEAVAAYSTPEKNKPGVGELTCTAPVELEFCPELDEGLGEMLFCELKELPPPQATTNKSNTKTANHRKRGSCARHLRIAQGAIARLCARAPQTCARTEKDRRHCFMTPSAKRILDRVARCHAPPDKIRRRTWLVTDYAKKT